MDSDKIEKGNEMYAVELRREYGEMPKLPLFALASNKVFFYCGSALVKDTYHQEEEEVVEVEEEEGRRGMRKKRRREGEG